MSASIEAALANVATQIGANIEDLRALIQMESSWNPKAYNASGAIGLIQFMPDTLKSFGLLSPNLASLVTTGVESEAVKKAVREEFLAKWPTTEAQLLGPVLRYFTRYKPFPTRANLFLAVLYPDWRNKPLTTMLPDIVRKQNPGIDTLGDYVNHVEKRIATTKAVKSTGIGAIALAAVASLWYLNHT